MDMKSLQGATTYTNAPNAAARVDNTLPRDRDIESSGNDLNSERTRADQKAFEVTITREAREKLAAETTRETLTTQTAPPASQTDQNITTAHETSQIVNIIA